MIRQKGFFALSALIHGLLIFVVFCPALIALPSALPLDETETVTIQVQYQSGGKLKKNSQPQAKRLKSISKKIAVLPTQNPTSGPSTVENGQGTSEDPTVLGSDLGIVAAYPRMSRILGEVGKVLVEITQNSNQAESKIQVSSGFTRLDESALNAVQSAIDQGLLSQYLKLENKIQVSFVFRLVEEKKEIN